MASHWAPRVKGSGQRRNPGIYSTPTPKPRRAFLEAQEEASSRTNSTSTLLSGGYPDTPKSGGNPSTSRSLHIEHSFRPANKPHREYSSNDREHASGLRDTREGTLVAGRDYTLPAGRQYYDHSVNDNQQDPAWISRYLEFCRYDIESRRLQTECSREPMSFAPSIYTTQYPQTTGSLRDTQPSWQRLGEDPRFDYLDVTTRSPMRPPIGAIAEDLPVYTTPSQDWKCMPVYSSDPESPSTAAPDSNGNSSDSDVPPVRRGFSSEDSPEGSSDSDVPASTDSARSPQAPSLVVLSSDEAASDSDVPASTDSEHPPSPEAPSIDVPSSDEGPLTARMMRTENSQCRHPLAVIGWMGDLPPNESSNTASTNCAQPLSPHPLPSKPPNCVFNARKYAQTAKGLSKALDTELRDLEDEMRDLTDDLMAIRRTIPSRSADGELVFSVES